MSGSALDIISENYSHFQDMAYLISGCHIIKNDILNEAFIKIHGVLQKNPSKKIEDGYVYRTMRNIFISMKRANREIIKESSFFVYMIEEDEDQTENRIRVNNALSEMPFVKREVLLKSQEVSMIEISRGSDVPYCRIRAIRKEGMEILESKLKQAI